MPVSFNAFSDYFQMSEEEIRRSFHSVMEIVANDTVLTDTFLPQMITRKEAELVERMHSKVHGVPGFLFSLDCAHFFWKNCPILWQGVFKNGKHPKPSIVLEAGVDHDLFFWHAAFGFPGTQNDINVWDRSPLLGSFIDGSFAATVDPIEPFQIRGEDFERYYMLVDGIYPDLDRFVKMIHVPVGEREKILAFGRKGRERT